MEKRVAGIRMKSATSGFGINISMEAKTLIFVYMVFIIRHTADGGNGQRPIFTFECLIGLILKYGYRSLSD